MTWHPELTDLTATELVDRLEAAADTGAAFPADVVWELARRVLATDDTIDAHIVDGRT